MKRQKKETHSDIIQTTPPNHNHDFMHLQRINVSVITAIRNRPYKLLSAPHTLRNSNKKLEYPLLFS